MKIVKQGETVSRSTKVDLEKQTVTKHHVTEHPTAGPVELTWTFDFSKCTPEQILEFASRDSVITKRRKFKECMVRELEGYPTVFDMSTVATREKLTDFEKAKRSATSDRISTEEKKELLKILEEQVKS